MSRNDSQFLKAVGIVAPGASLENPLFPLGSPTYRQLAHRCAALSQQQVELLAIQRRLIDDRNRWYGCWKWTAGALLCVVAAQILWMIVGVIYQ